MIRAAKTAAIAAIAAATLSGCGGTSQSLATEDTVLSNVAKDAADANLSDKVARMTDVISNGGDLRVATLRYLDAVERAKGALTTDELVHDPVFGLVAVADDVQPYCAGCADMIDRERDSLGK